MSDNSLTWQGETSGNTQALILPIAKYTRKNSKLTLTFNGKKISIPVSIIKVNPKKYQTNGLNSFVEVYETGNKEHPADLEMLTELTQLNKGLNSIFVKISQRDGNLAWSSPIFIKSNKKRPSR